MWFGCLSGSSKKEGEIRMNLKLFVVAVAIGLAVSVEAQENRFRETMPNVIRKNVAIIEQSKTQPVLSLSELVTQALENNPEIQAAKRKVESARARAGQATYL